MPGGWQTLKLTPAFSLEENSRVYPLGITVSKTIFKLMYMEQPVESMHSQYP